ncbi:hypothetical protein NLI96_g843 [Meripilus lineatus]|uniref:Gti1/Pac2 family-domain-containing protein n=1 Tax=Meripilus lineatus TaxID=2056292 RepID=A0AAD5YNI3_9APHY|nr:hypothetical protein NLI96_g843 [Physisporinus lineatus]
MASLPTCKPLRIRTVEDANQLFHAVKLGRAQLYTRRLTVAERRAIHTGCVFVWEERNPSLEASGEGIERWTDGRRWSCSRVKNDFLFYQEKLPEIGDEAFTAAIRYYTPDTAETLHSVDDFPHLADLKSAVPRGDYKPARITRGRPRPENPQYDTRAEESYGDFPAFRPYADDSPRSAPSPQPSSSGSESSLTRSDFSVEPRPDPIWVLQHGTRINMPEGASRITRSTNNTYLAPLVYKRQEPYRPRHPLDNDALRMFDTAPWMTAHW